MKLSDELIIYLYKVSRATPMQYVSYNQLYSQIRQSHGPIPENEFTAALRYLVGKKYVQEDTAHYRIMSEGEEYTQNLLSPPIDYGQKSYHEQLSGNDVQKKNYLVAIITLLTTLILGFIGILIPIILNNSKPQNSQPNIVSTLPPTLFVVSTNLPVIVASQNAPSLIITMPTKSELASTPNIWDLFTYDNLTKPGTLTYAVTIQSSTRYRWGALWCGTDDQILQDILKPLTMNLIINEQVIDRSKILEFSEQVNGLKCHRWATLISGWQSGTTTKLELNYSLSEQIYDGEIFIPAGEYHLIIYTHAQ
jgi:hypothetical protein